MKLPQPWATNDNYSSGPDVGSATKIDPASTANGFVRGTAAAAQHVNFNLHPLAENSRREFTMTSLALRVLAAEDQDDLSDGIGVAGSTANSGPTTIAKASTTGAVQVMGGSVALNINQLAQIVGSVKQCARRSTNVLAVGSGGTQNCRLSSTSWVAGGDTGVLTEIVSVAQDGTEFCVVTSAGESAHSTIGATWSNPAGGDDVSDVLSPPGVTSVAGITGVFVAVGPDGSGDTAFARSTDHGVTWVAASGTVPNAATQDNPGWVTGDATTFYHAAPRTQTCDIAASTDGNTWTTRATLTSALTISAVKIMKCDRTDLLVVAMQHTGIVEVRASTDGGLTWSEPEYLRDFALAGLGVADGRLFGSKGAFLFASDGIGAE